MAGITGLGTTFNLPNYTGELFALTPDDTPLLSSIGGLTGGGQTTSTEFEWQTYDLGDPGQDVALEGADAPTAEERAVEPARAAADPTALLFELGQLFPGLRGVALGEDDQGRDTVRLDGAGEPFGVLQGARDRLLQDQVLALLGGLDRDLGLHLRRHGERDRVDLGEHL